MNARCRCAVMTAFHQPIAVQELPMPASLAPGDVLVRVELAGVCGTDVHLHRGELKVPLPLIMGHETTGFVVDTGGPVSDWLGRPLSMGDRISWTVGIACGKCRLCRVYGLTSRCMNRRAYGVNTPCDQPPHLLGGYAEYHHLRAGTAMYRLPDDLPSESLIGAGCGLVTVVHGYARMPIRWGESVVVQGAGPVGLAAVALAREAGARPLIAIGGPSDRLVRCTRFGADVVIDIDQHADPAARRQLVLDQTEGLGADVVVECVGVPAAVAEGMELCRDGGRMLVLGQYCDAGPTMINPHLMVRKELTMIGSYGSEPRHWVAALELLRTRRNEYPFHELITHRFGLKQVNEALAVVASWKTGKAVIVPGA